MKISTAIRKGSKGREQGTEVYRDSNGEVCALGAAILGSGNWITSHVHAADIFPQLKNEVETEEGEVESIYRCVAYQNDHLGWSFTEIADWLEYYGY